MRYLRIVYPFLPPTEYSSNARVGWEKKRGKHGANNEVLDTMTMLVLEQGWDIGGEPMTKAHAVVVFHFPSKRTRDHGSFVERMKPLWDALVHLRVLSDDNIEIIGWPEYGHAYGKSPATVIEILESE